ncbi:MAG: EF-hand domain-containing protein [Synechococcus sp.]
MTDLPPRWCYMGVVASCAATLVASLAWLPPALAQDDIRRYGLRMEAMFVRMDTNRDGRLVPAEVRGQPYLEQRLRRLNSRGFLLLQDLHTRSQHDSGPRLQRHFVQADRNRDGRLNQDEAQTLPWVSRHFASLDRNSDGFINLRELWALQKALAPRKRP